MFWKEGEVLYEVAFRKFLLMLQIISGITRHRQLGGHPLGHAICKGAPVEVCYMLFNTALFIWGGTLAGHLANMGGGTCPPPL